jgi:hypothetical protein
MKPVVNNFIYGFIVAHFIDTIDILDIVMTIDSLFFEYAKRFYINCLAYELRSDARTKGRVLIPICYHPSRKRFNFMCLRRRKLMLQGIWPPETAEGAKKELGPFICTCPVRGHSPVLI